MPSGSIFRKKTTEKKWVSLSTKMFNAILLFSIVLSLAAIIFAFRLYSNAVINQYAGIAYNISRTAAIVLQEEDAVHFQEDVYEIFRGLSPEQTERKDTREYRLLYADAVDNHMVDLQILLGKIAEENGLMKISLVTYDRSSEKLINIFSSDRSEPAGYWYTATNNNSIFNRPGKYNIYDSDVHYKLDRDDKGYVCTSWTKVAEDEYSITMVITEIDMYQADNEAAGFLWQLLALLMGLTLVVFAIIDRRMKKDVVKPILDMNQAARNYIADKDDGLPDEFHFQSLDIHTNDEIESLAVIFAEMEKEISQYVENLTRVTAERERINSELNVAAQIQRGTLPSVFPPYPDMKQFDIYASVVPAKEVGGDFYDFFLIDDSHLALVVADVSGKGIPAALFMMACKILISNLTSVGITDPATILSMVNNRIVRDNPLDMFVTVWLGILDINTGVLTASNGGHEYPCLQSDAGKFEILKDRHGLVLGGMADSTYYTYDIQLTPGDAIFVYTDGVPESTSENNELFGLDRMLDSLNRDADLPLDQLLNNVSKDIDEFVGNAPQFDDITMLALRYNGGGNMNELTVEAIIDNVPAVTRFVDEKLEALECPLRAQTQIDVAIDELFSNIAKYAYHPDTGPATVRVEVEEDPMAVIITFIDHGVPYDPLSNEAPDITLSAEQRQVGGLGIYLVRKTMDDISYEYKNGQNILRIKKAI